MSLSRSTLILIQNRRRLRGQTLPVWFVQQSPKLLIHNIHKMAEGMETAAKAPVAEQALPELSPADFRAYNRGAEQMEYYARKPPVLCSLWLTFVKHEHFRQTWNILYLASSSGKRPAGMSIRQFLSVGLEFCDHLDLHHSIEERHIFPVLAKKMSAFREELELRSQHKEIHKGLDKFQVYLADCSLGKRELRLQELKTLMDAFAEVLWAHLSDEVDQLKAENMRKYWSLDEMKRMPW